MAGFGALGLGAGLGAVKPAPAAAQGREVPNALLIVVDGIRADFVSAYDDHHDLADTPNLDRLAEESLRFEMALPEAMVSLPARRAILTGMRTYPFRDWRRSEGFAPHPGWNPVRAHHPVMTEVMQDGGVTPIYIADNPLLDDRFEGVHRTPGGTAPDVSQAKRYVAPVVPGGVDGDERAITRAVNRGISSLSELKSKQPFFLAVDTFDPVEATEPTPVYGSAQAVAALERAAQREDGTRATTYGATETVAADGDARERVRENYAKEVKAVDAEIGRLLDELNEQGLAGNTVVYLVSATTTALGEHGVFGSAAAAGHEEVYKVAYMIRDPDRRRAGDEVRYYASTHDVAPTLLSYMNLTCPGKMEGEDLTAFFDEDDPAPRHHFTTVAAGQIVVGDRRYVLVTDIEGQEKRLYDTDPPEHEDERGDEDDFSPRTEDEDVSREEGDRVNRMWQAALHDAGGTIPKFGPEAPIRPREEADENDDEDVDEGRLDRDDDLNFAGQ